ncbi:MFS transporter [Microbacterium sp. 22242]|uniref:MFS transporter n=1 Tax=Microbacterium sp. 22242 TaxID=3453896 RepID=UPI003F82B281
MTTSPFSRESSLADPTPTEAFDPRVRPRRGFVFFLVAASVGSGAALLTAALLTLTLKAEAIDARSATSIISLSSSIVGVLTLVALPALGALSDRSQLRIGRRRPLLIASAAFFALGGILLITAPNVALYVLAHVFLTLGNVASVVAVTALIADQLPPNRRGPASAFVSLSTAMGALLGMAVAQPFGADLLPLVGIPTALGIIGNLLLALVVADPQVRVVRAKVDLRKLLSVYWVNPVRFPDFTWVFTSRMLVFSGVAALNGYQAIFLLMHLHLKPAQLGSAILATVVINVVISLLIAPLIAKLSDRLGVRKPFIVVAAIILGAGLIFAAMAPTFPLYLVACGVVAIGQGVYFAVELALATRVLPDPDNPAKDLGIIKVADNLPVSIVSALAPALLAVGVVTAGNQNFAALFLAGAISAVLGGIVILFVKGAR